MASALKQFSYRQQADEFGSACAWLKDLGIRIENNRIAGYRKNIEAVAEYHERGRIQDLLSERDYSELIYSHLEASELIDIYKGLRSVPCSDLVNRLREAVSGCVMLTDEDPSRNPVSNKPRNIAFELDMASHLARCGYKIDPKPPCDVWMTLPEFPVAVECKRPFSYKGLESAFKDGMTQLHRRYENHSDLTSAKGMLALSISKAENDGSLFLNAQTQSELAEVYKLSG